MELILSLWGNSLGLRIPKSVSKTLGIRKGSKVSAELKEGRLILSPVKPSSLKTLAAGVPLKALSSKVTAENRHSIDEEDAPVGNEVW